MKNKLKIFCILCLITFMSGCVKYNFKMEVGKDNSFTFAITSALDKSMMEQMGGEDSSVLDEEEVAAIKAKGFTLEDYAEDNWTGYIITKKFANIDDISASEPVTVNINDILDTEKEDIKNYFQKDGDTYKADFLVDLTDDSEEEDTETDGTTTEETDPETEQYMQQFIDTMDLKYEVTLPETPLSNNATSVSEDGKTLTWNLEYGKVNEVKFEFKKYVDPAKENDKTTNNTTDNKESKKDDKDDNMILYVGVGVGVLAVIIIIVLILKKKKTPPTNSGTPVDNSTNLNTTNDTTNNNPTTSVEPVAAEPAVQPTPIEPVVTPTEETTVATDTATIESLETEPTVQPNPVEPVAAPTEVTSVNSDTTKTTIEELSTPNTTDNSNNN